MGIFSVDISCYEFNMCYNFSTIRSIYGEKLMDCCPDQNNCQELNEWFERVKKEVKNYEEADGKGAAEFGAAFTEMMKKNEK